MRAERGGIQIGELVESVSGHDRGGRFLVVRREGAFLWLCDGKHRKAGKCKKKKQKHVRGTGLVCAWMESHPERMNNTSVRKAIREMLNQ